MDEGATTEVTAVPQKVLVLLGEGLQITAVSLATAKLASDEPLLLAEWGISMPIRQAVVVDLDEQLLLISSHYRFLLLTPRQLLDLQSMEMHLTDLHRLEKRESFALLGRWTKNRDAQKMLLITNRGYARAYPLAILRANIEAPVPLKFDHPLLGTPIALFGTENKATFAAVTHGGRGLRWSVSDLRAAGAQVVNCGKDDLIAAAVLAEPEDELFILTADGYARRLLSEWLPRPPKPNSKGRSLIARRSPVVGLIQSTNEGRPLVKVVTSQRVISVGNGRIPLEDSTKSYRLLNLRADEIVHCIVS
jgi:DNA gyrase/topoisomerase IV subunit A